MNYEELLKIIVCPVCRGDLGFLETPKASGFECERCAVVYPIRDTIPVLLPEAAKPAAEWREENR